MPSNNYVPQSKNKKHITAYNLKKGCVIWTPALDRSLEEIYLKRRGDRKGTVKQLQEWYPDKNITENSVTARIQKLKLPGKVQRQSYPRLIACGVTMLPHVRDKLEHEMQIRGRASFAGFAGELLHHIVTNDLFDAVLDDGDQNVSLAKMGSRV